MGDFDQCQSKKKQKNENILFITDNFLQHQKMDLTYYPSVFHKQRIENNMVLSKDIFLRKSYIIFLLSLKFELSCEGCTNSYVGLTLSTQKYMKLI